MMNPDERYTPAHSLGKVFTFNGIECVRFDDVNEVVKKSPGIYMVIGETPDGFFCYIGLAKKNNLADRAASHINVKRSVNELMREFKRKYTTDITSRRACMFAVCLETHDYSGMDECEKVDFMNDREVFHWEVACSIFGDARMLNKKEPQRATLKDRSEPIRIYSRSGVPADWESAYGFCKTMRVSREKLQEGIEMGNLYGLRVEKDHPVEFPFNTKTHNKEDYQPKTGIRQGGEKHPVRMWLRSGLIVDWESGRQLCEIVGISWKTLKKALKTKNLYGLRVEKDHPVEFPFAPETHKPEDYQPPPELRSNEAKIIRMRLRSGLIVDWKSTNKFCKMTGFKWKTLYNALDNKGGVLGDFHVEKVTTVVFPFDPEKHKQEDYSRLKGTPTATMSAPNQTPAMPVPERAESRNK